MATITRGAAGPTSWARRVVSGRASNDSSVSLEAENLFLRDELDRARLSLSGAHRATTMVDALRTLEEASTAAQTTETPDPEAAKPTRSVDEDAADEVVALHAQTQLIRRELLHLVGLLSATLADFTERLDQLENTAVTEPVERQTQRSTTIGPERDGSEASSPQPCIPPGSRPIVGWDYQVDPTSPVRMDTAQEDWERNGRRPT